jgi:hypothetical protein
MVVSEVSDPYVTPAPGSTLRVSRTLPPMVDPPDGDPAEDRCAGIDGDVVLDDRMSRQP